MACENEIHLNDIGTILEVTIRDCDDILDISGAITKQIILRKAIKPYTVVTKSAAFKTDGTDGILTYTTIDGDLDEIGNWKLQAVVELPTGKWSSDITGFKVYDNLL